jgi:hypothetical protein
VDRREIFNNEKQKERWKTIRGQRIQESLIKDEDLRN